MKNLFLISLTLVLAGLFQSSLLFAQEDDAPFQKSSAAFNKGDYDRAIAELTKEIQNNPQSSPAFFRRAYVYMTIGNEDKALADLTQAIQIDPKFAQAYYRRAFVYMMKADYNDAISDLTREIQIDPGNTKAYFRRANVYMMNGNYDQALADLNQDIQIDPAFTQAYDKRCFVYMLKGNYDLAIANLNQTIQSHPKNVNARNRLAWLLATCPIPGFRDGKKAVDNATTACDLTRWRLSGQFDTLAAAYAESGDFANAINWETKAIASQKDPDILNDQKSRFALYQSGHPYHVDKYVPQLDLLIK